MKVIFFVAILQLILATVFAAAPAAAPADSSAVCKLLIGVGRVKKPVDAPSGKCVDIPDTDHIYRIDSETGDPVALKIFARQKCPKGQSAPRQTPVTFPYRVRVRSFIATC